MYGVWNVKKLEYYLGLHWTYRLEWDDRDNVWVARIAELDGCASYGNTPEEAIKNVRSALAAYIKTMLEEGAEIPEPPKPEEYKGRISLRTTPEKHYKLVRKAAAAGKSLNSLLDELIEREVA
jgi:predicted RNase H-like HicB family nuclease